MIGKARPVLKMYSTGRSRTNTSATPLFLPVVCTAAPQPALVPPSASSIEVILADGLRIAIAPGFDPQTLRRVIDALRHSSC
jgi:hypothetical protein